MWQKTIKIFIISFFVTTFAIMAGCSENKRAEIDSHATTQPKIKTAQLSATANTPESDNIITKDCQNVEDELDFIDCMVHKPKCTVADAVRAICMLESGGDIGQNYQQRYEYLKQRGIIRDNWHLKPEQWIDRGTLAYMLLKTAKIKGGINIFLFASWGLGDRRYAYREMLYHELMEEGVSYNYVSGPELITAVGNVDRYMQSTGEYSPPEEIKLGNRSQYETGNIRIPRKKTQKRNK